MRFDLALEDTYEILTEVLTEHFPELINCKIAIIFDNKKRLSGGNVVISSIQKPNEMLRFFTIDDSDSDEGYNYVIRIDKKAWNNIEKIDKERIIRHELRHTLVNLDSNDPYKIIGHSVNDFFEEIDLNKNDPRWNIRISELIEYLYDDNNDNDDDT